MVGRFTQEDIARDGLNWYTYCRNNPIMLIDPTGMVALANIGNGSIFGGIDGQYYGGNQAWFSKSNEEWLRNSACGTIAASNMMAYMAQTQPSLSGLYSQPDMTKSSYLAHQYDVLSKISPGYITIGGQPGIGTGIWSAVSLKAGVISYAKDKGVSLEAFTLHNGNRIPLGASAGVIEDIKQNAISFIDSALQKDLPVAMLVKFNSRIPDFDTHWMTITELNLNSANNQYELLVSSWGKDYTLSLDDVWFGGSAEFVYFDKKKTPNKANK